MNKAGEGASKGKKIFQITNATKFPEKRELPIKWLHTIGGWGFIETGHNVDRLIFNRKIVCEITSQNSISKRMWNIHCWAIRAPTSDIKPRTRSRPGQFQTVTVKRPQLSPKMYTISLFFSIDTIIIIYKPLVSNIK